MNARHALATVAGLLVMAACAQPKFNAAAASNKLLARDAEWSDVAYAGKDVEKIISYWSDDAVIIPQAEPVVEGKAAIRTYITEGLKIPGFHIRWVSENPTFSPDSKLAYMRGSSEITLTGPDGKPMHLHGRGVTIWRLDPDGEWRCALDTWNYPPEPTPKK